MFTICSTLHARKISVPKFHFLAVFVVQAALCSRTLFWTKMRRKRGQIRTAALLLFPVQPSGQTHNHVNSFCDLIVTQLRTHVISQVSKLKVLSWAGLQPGFDRLLLQTHLWGYTPRSSRGQRKSSRDFMFLEAHRKRTSKKPRLKQVL